MLIMNVLNPQIVEKLHFLEKNRLRGLVPARDSSRPTV